MSSLVAKRISSCFFSSSLLYHHRHLAPLTPLLRHPLSTRTQQQKEIPFVSQYLISAMGFSPARALKVSTDKKLGQINSSSQPDSVVRLLKETGLSDAKIKSAISFNPSLLSLSVDKILKPKLHQLIAAGFTGEILVELIRHNPFIFELKTFVAPLQFWRGFMGNSDDAFLKLIQRNGLLITRDIDNYVTPRMNLLKEYGFSDKEIVKLLSRAARFLQGSLDNLSRNLKQTEEFGFARESNMFLYGLIVIGGNTKESIEKKFLFFKKMYGWSDEDTRLAFVKYPYMLSQSEERVKAIMDFLIKDAGFEPRSIASQPTLLSYSLEKTLVPRHHVLSILKACGLKKDYKLLNACVMSEKRFLEHLVMPHEKDVPRLAETYAAARLGKVPLSQLWTT